MKKTNDVKDISDIEWKEKSKLEKENKIERRFWIYESKKKPTLP